MTQQTQIKQALTALENNRPILGNSVVETATIALTQQLEAIKQSQFSTERKQVTVMFADISGFTAMSEKLDPEEVRSMINTCFDTLVAVIKRYDGYIDKFIGDEIMALFGAPIAHENDPERALRSALDMVETLNQFNIQHADRIPKPLALHFGINTGLVIAGGIGSQERQDYSVMGDPVNLASRLEGLSETGEILVGETTYRLTAPLFDFEALEPVKVKGKEDLVQVYRLLKAKPVTPGQIRGVEGLFSPLVGRDDTLNALKETVTALQQKQGWVASLIGEAGLGKTRLMFELKQVSTTYDFTWAEGRALSYGEDASYLLIRNLFQDLLALSPDTTPIQRGEILRSEIEQHFPDRFLDIYPYLGHLLEVQLDDRSLQRVKYLDGKVLQQHILRAAQEYLLAKANHNPLILICDDLHWADPSSLHLIEMLLPFTHTNPLSIFLVYRPRRQTRVWQFHQKVTTLLADKHHIVELNPLTKAESIQLLQNLLSPCTLEPQVQELLVTKAEGNPFYVEEMLRTLIDRRILKRRTDDKGWVLHGKIEDVTIPDTLQGVVMSRIDNLNPEMKRVLQMAAVIGRTFSYDLLAEVVGE